MLPSDTKKHSDDGNPYNQLEALEREEKREQLRQDALAAWATYQTTGLHLTAAEADA